MANNKLFTHIITGTAIIASLTTGGMAGMKVLASRNIDTEVPEIIIPTPSPFVVPTPATTPVPVSAIPVVSSADVTTEVSPSPTSTNSEFPLASISPSGKFDDEGVDDENELEHEDDRGSKESEKIEIEDHENN